MSDGADDTPAAGEPRPGSITGKFGRRPGGTFWQWLRRTARLWGFLAFIILVLAIFRAVILPFLLALLVAYVLAPLVRWLSSKRLVRGRCVPRFAWVIVIYACILGLMALFITTFVPHLTADMKKILASTPAMMKEARTRYIPAVADWAQQTFGEPPTTGTVKSPPVSHKVRLTRLKDGEAELDVSGLRLEVVQEEEGRWVVQVPRPQAPLAKGKGKLADSIESYLGGFVARSESQLKKLVGIGQKVIKGIFATITTFILVLMISAFLLVDTERILAWFRNLMPKIYYDDFDRVIKRIDKGLSGAIRGQFIICLINGALTWIGLRIIGVNYPELLALLAAVMSLIPIFGSIISSIPIVLVALASGTDGISIVKGVLILLWIIAIHLVEANLLNPKIMGTAAKIHPVIVIFAVVAGERTFGPMGALLGVPIVSAVQALFIYMRRKVRGELDADTDSGGDTEPGERPASA